VGPLGINGVALATLISLAISNGWLIPRVIYSALGVSLWQKYLLPMLKAAAVVAPFVVLMRVAVSPLVEGSLALALAAAVVWVAVGVPLTAAVVFTPAEFRVARDAVRRRLAHRLSG
jgi:hypothetical protein